MDNFLAFLAIFDHFWTLIPYLFASASAAAEANAAKALAPSISAMLVSFSSSPPVS